MKPILLTNFHVFWYDNDRRECLIASDADEFERMKNLKKPVRIRSYLDQAEMIEEDQKLWRKLNN